MNRISVGAELSRGFAGKIVIFSIAHDSSVKMRSCQVFCGKTAVKCRKTWQSDNETELFNCEIETVLLPEGDVANEPSTRKPLCELIGDGAELTCVKCEKRGLLLRVWESRGINQVCFSETDPSQVDLWGSQIQLYKVMKCPRVYFGFFSVAYDRKYYLGC